MTFMKSIYPLLRRIGSGFCTDRVLRPDDAFFVSLESPPPRAPCVVVFSYVTAAFIAAVVCLVSWPI
jgi:hypothetical protein